MLTTRDDLSGLKLLYVEDDASTRESLTRFLSRRISDIVVAKDGEEGLRLFNEVNPDMIVTDIRMPIMDGLTMIEEIRKISHDIPIIITSAYSDEEFYQKAIDLGVDKYIKKPISLKDLVNVISLSARTIVQQRELDAQNKLILNILDISQNFMLITDGKVISYVNKALLYFAMCQSLDEFNSRGGLSRLLVSFGSVFYKGKSFEELIHTAINSPDPSKLIVYMQSPDLPGSEIMAFLLQVNMFPLGREILISFSDVTNIEREKLYYQEIAQYDELTKIFNRKKFNEALVSEIDRVIRYKQHLSLSMFDVDFFKRVNDTYGHLIGDKVLKEIVQIVNRCIRKSDVFCRYGGEEFVLLMPETTVEASKDTMERIRKVLEENTFGEVGQVTCSFGIAQFSLDDTPESFVARADEALYAAKNNGRNRVEVIDKVK